MFNNRHDFRGRAAALGASDCTLRAISLLERNNHVLTDIISVKQSQLQQLKPDVKCNTATYKTNEKIPRLHSQRNSTLLVRNYLAVNTQYMLIIYEHISKFTISETTLFLERTPCLLSFKE
jgi:hypothetical protein